jgi:uncharacterized RDD family membrane protein YckC
LSTQPSAHLNFEPTETLTGAAEESSSSAAALREQAAARLAAHRARRSEPRQAAVAAPQPKAPSGKSASVAAAVAARYAKAQSYRDFLAAEAEEALRRAEAAAEIAARNAEAIAAAQKTLLAELEQQSLQREDLVREDLVREIDQWNGVSSIADEQAVLIDTALSLPALEMMHAPQDSIGAAIAMHADLAVALDAVTEKQPEAVAHPVYDALDTFIFEPVAPPTPLPANLIEFPRVLVATRKARPRLAEGPLREEADAAAQLRIFEVEADSLSPQPAEESAMPEWSSIRLDAAVPQHAIEHPHTPASYTIPIQTAALRPRIAAFAADTGLALAATLVFAGVFAAMAHHAGLMPEMKSTAVAIVGVFLLLKLAYQILFFTLNECTPGMRMARIALCTFNDDNPTRKALRRRIGATVLATCPMGLGLVWSWFDVDRLGWHDRITRTYQRSY